MSFIWTVETQLGLKCYLMYKMNERWWQRKSDIKFCFYLFEILKYAKLQTSNKGQIPAWF